MKLRIPQKVKLEPPVRLEEVPGKGKGLVSNRPIKKGEVLAYYRIKVFKTKGYKSPTNGIYLFTVYRKGMKAYKNFVGDIYEGSFPAPEGGIPFTAPYANEPTVDETSNADIDLNFEENFANRTKIVPGDIVTYKLYATRDIDADEEITWYYGADYPRTYEVGR